MKSYSIKNILAIFLVLFSVSNLFSQGSTDASSRINYQFTIRNASNNLVANQSVGVEVSILQGSETGLVVYSEVFMPSTNVNGLATIEIGGGSNLTGNYNTIDWSKGPFFLKTRVRLPSEKVYSITGTSKFLSVPYALNAKKADKAGNGISSIQDNNNGTLTINYLDGSKYITPILKGLTGPKGEVGLTGATGPQGIQGVKGDIGLTGAQGPIGLKGATGPQGIQGLKGDVGATGLQGIQGVAGTNGINGLDGKTVLNGTVAPLSTTGNNGDFYINTSIKMLYGPKTAGIWPSGVSLVGPTGSTGPQGIQGLKGDQGLQGIQGVAGTNGINGLDGKTVLNGTVAPLSTTGNNGDFYINTSTKMLYGPKTAGAWPSGVSLVGPTGSTGPQGPIGLTGPAGAQGPIGLAGSTGATGPQGPIGLTGATGPQGVQGLKGDQGLQGIQGVAGTNGINGLDGKTVLNGTIAPLSTTGNNGDFYINTSTKMLYGPKTAGVWPAGVSLVGPIGVTGLQGVQGITGLQGPIGLTGATGPQGVQGLKGDNGATGPQGIQGLKGDQGVAGTNGINGLDGKTVLNGTVAPLSTTGNNGDFYINTSSNMLYGPKTAGIWPSGVTLVGPTGSTGPQGTTGAQGPIGLTGSTGLTGPAGSNGINGTNGQNALAKTTTEVGGVNCPTGGLKVEYGLDANNNGTLDVSEINATLTKYVCNGTVGSTGVTGAQGIQGTTGSQGPIGLTGNTGATGPAGTNGTNGTNGQNALAKTTNEAAGTNCSTGGVKVEYGLDANSNGTLDVSEINATLTKYVCNGAVGSTGATGVQGIQGTTGSQGPIGLTGATGPQGIQGATGSTGSTGPAGTNGTNGQNALAKTTPEAAGANCPTGGVKVEYGLDANNNGTLDVSEINATLTKYVCNGAIGATGAQGIQGATGANGSIGPIGLTGATGAQGIQGSTGATGPQGIQGTTGLTGATGAVGTNGTNGTNGQNALVKTSTIAVGATCANGGLKIEFGLDANNNGVLDLAEIDARVTNYVCNGLDGATGANGSNGPIGLTGPTGPQGTTGNNGKNTLVKTTNEAAGANCTTGGKKVEIGLDTDSDGVLSITEVDANLTTYVCNGEVGPLVSGTSGQTLRNDGTSWIATSNLYNNGTQIGVGTTTPNTSAIVDISSTAKGVLMPTMTQAQRDAITTPATGLLVFQSDNTPGFYFYDGTAWVAISTSASSGTGSNSNTLLFTTDGF